MTEETASSAWQVYDELAQHGDLAALDSVCLNAQIHGVLLGDKVPDLNLDFPGLIAQSALPNNKALDLGIAAGSTSALFAQNAFDVTGVDISQAALDRAVERGVTKQTHRLNLDHGIPEGVIADAEYGLVLCTETLFYLKNTIQMIDDMLRVCAPGGIMAHAYLSENKAGDPNGMSIGSGASDLDDWPEDIEPPKFFQPYVPRIDGHLTKLEMQGKLRCIGKFEMHPYYAMRDNEPLARLHFFEKAAQDGGFTDRHIPENAHVQIFVNSEHRVRKALGLTP